MTTPDIEAEVPATGGWRFKLGIAIFIFAFALWLILPLAGSMGASAGRIAALTGTVFIANKVLLVTCIAVMGKAGFQNLKQIIFGHAKRLAPSKTVGPVRHAIGLVMFFVPLVWALLESYVDKFWPGLRPNIWQLQLLGDLVLIGSFFVLGGNFWTKIHALFLRTA
ncbi:transporter suffix domain-containing protein [Paraburkholderia fungorum]|uniref:transporter suffix domain-containing protein n=1 Tax=Paraburkholderia fungorum TaxID=134537 RepID=UPI0038BC5784